MLGIWLGEGVGIGLSVGTTPEGDEVGTTEGKTPEGGVLGDGEGAGESVGEKPVGDGLGLGEAVGGINVSVVGLSLGAEVISTSTPVKMGDLSPSSII